MNLEGESSVEPRGKLGNFLLSECLEGQRKRAMSHRDEPDRVDSICHDKAFHPFGCNRVRLGSRARAMQLLLGLPC